VSIWSDRDIENEITCKRLIIEPFHREQVQPASYDVRLGDQVLIFDPFFVTPLETDTRKPVRMQTGEISQFGWVIEPQEFLLAVTQEKITLNAATVGRIEGKSSLGRLGLSVHVTAGFIDPGFSGYLTLEMFNASPRPIRLYAGMFIAQISFENTRSICNKPYNGRYKDAGDKCEPTASRVNQRTEL